MMIWVVTAPGAVADEAPILHDLFSAGLETLLLRKPGWTAAEYKALVQCIAPGFRHRVMLAGYPELVEPFGLKGLHLSERLRKLLPVPEIAEFRASGFYTSTSIHTTGEEYTNPEDWDFMLLGPVFDSISKTGYYGRSFTDIPYNGIGIGGITPGNAGKLQPMGFCGAALLGAIWQEPRKAVEVFAETKAGWK